MSLTTKNSKNNVVKYINTTSKYRKIKIEETPSVSLKVFQRAEEQKTRKLNNEYALLL